MYILSIYLVYHKYILQVYHAYTLYMHGINHLYAWYIPCSIYHVYSWNIQGIQKHALYIHEIYLVYTWYIPTICRTNTYGWYICCCQQTGLFSTSHIPYKGLDIPLISKVCPTLYRVRERYQINPFVSNNVYTIHMYKYISKVYPALNRVRDQYWKTQFICNNVYTIPGHMY